MGLVSGAPDIVGTKILLMPTDLGRCRMCRIATFSPQVIRKMRYSYSLPAAQTELSLDTERQRSGGHIAAAFDFVDFKAANVER